MKSTLIVIAIFLTVLVCWHLLTSKKGVQSFIPGTYIAAWSIEHAAVKDTLLISFPDNSGSNRYHITRRTSYDYVEKERQPEYKIVRWTGFYNKEQKTLLVQNNGRELSFDPHKKILIMGITKYNKL